MSLSPLKRGLFGLALGLALGAATAGSAFAASIKLGVMGGSEEEIAEVAKQVAAKHGLEVELVTFSDYAIPNEALENGELDANAFQHKPYLDAQIAARGYHIVPIGFTIVEPIGLYSKKIASLDKLPDGAKIGIPNDPSNGGRALNLLAAHGLIKLAGGQGPEPVAARRRREPAQLRILRARRRPAVARPAGPRRCHHQHRLRAECRARPAQGRADRREPDRQPLRQLRRRPRRRQGPGRPEDPGRGLSVARGGAVPADPVQRRDPAGLVRPSDNARGAAV